MNIIIKCLTIKAILNIFISDMYLRIKRELESSTGKITSLSASRGRLDFMREENMKVFISKRQHGQTLIETALILFVILLILLGISEFARAWFVKNTLKNAVRQGARVAALTPRDNLLTSFSCVNPTCPETNPVKNAVCCQPGVPKKAVNNTLITLLCSDNNGNSIGCDAIVLNGSVQVTATTNFLLFFIIKVFQWSSR